MKLFSKFGLTARFISWFLGISLICVGVVAYLSYDSAKKNLETASMDALEIMAEANEAKVIEYFNTHNKVMEALAVNGTLQAHTDLKLVQAEIEEAFGVLGKEGIVSEIFFMDADGKILASSNKANIGIDKKSDDYFVSATQKKGFHIKDLYKSTTTGKTEFVVSLPVFGHEGSSEVAGVVAQRIGATGVQTGVLAERLSSDGIFTQLAHDADAVGTTGDIYIVNHDGYLLTPNRFQGEDAILKTKLDTQHIKDCLEGKEYHGLAKDYRGQDVFGGYSSAEVNKAFDKKWCVVVEKDLAEIDIPVVALRNQVLAVVGILLIVVFGLALFASKSVGDFIRNPIKKAIEQLTASANQLSATSQQTSASSQQNSSISQQVASGATQQSHQAEEISKTVSQMAAALQQMSASAKEVALGASQAASSAQKAGKSGEQSRTSLGTIKSVIGGTSTTVKSLAEKSSSIGNIVETITGIAEQTNLLALNAAIEAARAGDAGRGFAVVADEVRKLAESSREAAGEIKDIVKGMSSTIDDTVTSVEEGTKSVDAGSKVIEEALGGIQGISAAIQQLSSKIQEVTAAIEQQASAVQQVAKTMDSIAAVAEQNSSGAQQLSASTQQLSAANQQVAGAAQQIQDLTSEMEKLVGKVEHARAIIATKNTTTAKELASEPSTPAKALKEKETTKRNKVSSIIPPEKESSDAV